MAFDLFGGGGGTPTVTPQYGTGLDGRTVFIGPSTYDITPKRQDNVFGIPQMGATYLDGSTVAGNVQVPQPLIFGGATTIDGGEILPGHSPYDVQAPRQPGLNVGRVPNMPEGYGYANGFPFRGSQPPGWNIGNASVPGWAMDSTGFNWADRNAYGSGTDKTSIKFNSQGKDKGIAGSKAAQDNYNKISNLAKDAATAGFQQYRADNKNSWGIWYDAALGKGNYDTQHWWNSQDYNNLSNMFVDSAGNPIEMGIQVMQPTTQQQTQNQGTSAYMNTLANRMLEAQRKQSVDWLRRYDTGRTIADTFLGQSDRLAERLTAKPKTVTGGGNTGDDPNSRRAYYGGGGGGWGGYGGGSYTPSWYNGLLSWRI